MNTFYIHYLILASFVNLFDFKIYIHYQINGSLDNEHGMNFTIFITKFTGVVIYSLDRNNNTFLMELERGDGSKKIVFKFKEFHVNEDSKNICGCRKCEGVMMTVSLKLKHSNVYIDCNNNKHSISFTGSLKWPDQFSGYPIPINFWNLTNKTFIWMGNIGPYHGNKDVIYLPISNQLMGCMKLLYFGNIKIDESKNECKTFTNIKANQRCSFLNLENSKKIEYSFENKIKLYTPQTYNYNTDDIAKFGFPIKIDWKLVFPKANQNFSLINMLLNNQSLISVQINNHFKITLIMEKYGLIQCSKEFDLVGQNEANSIIIDFINNRIKIFIYHDDDSFNMMEDEIFLLPHEVYITPNQSVEDRINGTITFHYSLRHFTTTRSQDANQSSVQDFEIVMYIACGSLFFIFLFILIIMLSKYCDCKFSPQIYTESNCSEKRQINFVNISRPIADSEIYDVIT